MNINPGEFKHTIYIFERNLIKDEDGFLKTEPLSYETVKQYIYDFFKQFSYNNVNAKDTVVIKMKAKINSVTGTELIKSNSTFENVKKRFLIRYIKKCEKLNTDMYILSNKKIYEIKYINNYNENNEYVEILAERVDL